MKKIFLIIAFMLTALCFADERRDIYISPSAGAIYTGNTEYTFGLGFTGTASFPLSKHFDIHGTAGFFFFTPKDIKISLFVWSLGFDYIFNKNFKLGLDISFFPGITFTLFEHHRISVNLSQLSDIAVTYGYSIPIRKK